MTKPIVYNYETAENKIASLKELVNYMASRIEKLEAENEKLYRELTNITIKNRILEADK